MRLPRDISGGHLAGQLSKHLGYKPARQSGSHLRLTTELNGTHHITIPLHDNLRIGTLNSILTDVAQHISLTKEELLHKLSL